MAGATHILTGAPGAGKTTVLRALPPSLASVDEPARQIIAGMRAAGGDPRSIRTHEFVRRILELAVADFTAMSGHDCVVFDRGLPDCVAYARHLAVDPTPALTAARQYRHDGLVFLFEPWEDIYTTDEDRTMTFDATVSFHDEVLRAYREAEYEWIIVPRGTPAERAAFVATRVQ
jgi:predicted ATPase